MNDHTPSPDFRASLKRELARTYRETQFDSPGRMPFAKRAGLVVTVIAGTIFTLAVGLALGTSTGYAAARAEQVDTTQNRGAPTVTAKHIPMQQALALACNTIAQVSAKPQSVPIVDLPPAKTKTAATFGGIIGVREVSGGKLLVNDAGRRQLFAYDTLLLQPRLVFDSTEGNANSYGSLGVALRPYAGDSSIMVDLATGPGSVLVLDGQGKIARSLALPSASDAAGLAFGNAGIDNKGRIAYDAPIFVHMPRAGTTGVMEAFVDSTPVLRADLDTRRTDTVGRVATSKGEVTRVDHMEAKKILRTVVINPLPSPDEWAVLTDGSIAFVRGHDYHIDWVRPDGSTSSSPKLPFDWKRLTDGDKRKLIDSAMAAHAAQNALAQASRALPPPPPPPVDDSRGGSGQRSGGGAGISYAAYDGRGNLYLPLNYEVVQPKDIADYYPAIRKGAAMADLDNHLWILPTTSAQSRNGELVYDVVSSKGELIERVRVPAGRSIAGFGKGGVVYLQAGDKTNGFVLERTRLR
jgi:hypothetical protein